MQARTASKAARGRKRWGPGALIAAACATAALAGAPATGWASAPTAAPKPTTYRVVPLSPTAGGNADINAKGQVAFTDFVGEIPRARFYDGSSVRDLGTFGGLGAVANAVNELGQVAGTAATAPPGTFHAFRWSKHTGLVDLNRPGVGNSTAIDINNRGQVVGAARFPGPQQTHAFRWSPHTGMVDLGSLGTESVAVGINDAGTAVGLTDAASSGTLIVAAKWPAGGGTIALNGFPSIASVANDINNSGQIVGSAAFDDRLNDQAFLWTAAGGLQGMGTEPSFHSFAERINQKGLVIGDLMTTPGDRNGFIWSRENGLLVVGTPLVDFSDVTDVNNLGQVVGHLNGRAFVWTRARGFIDLASRIVGAPAEFGLFTAMAISDNGSIVAATMSGAMVLLVPQAGYSQPPVAGPINYTGSARVNALLSFSASFKDVDVRDTHKAVWSWGDGSKSTGVVSTVKGSGSVSGQHTWRAPGIYTVALTITDSSGKSSTVQRTVVVCASAAATLGAGAFASPAGAARPGALQAPVGSFAFLSEGREARKASVQVNVAGMALRSRRVDAVALDGTRVQYSGRGTVNGSGNYRFTLTATRGAQSGGKDRIHVRISHTEPGSTAEVIDYDNGTGTGATTAATGRSSTHALGSVVIGEGRIELGAR